MHRNTYIVITFLAVFAALVVGVNLGRRFVPTTGITSTPSPLPSPNVSPTPTNNTYSNKECGISLSYPTTLTLVESATGSALFVHTTDKDQSVVIACQSEIPKPALTADNIENLVVYNETNTASVSARLFHDVSAKDGTAIDELIFRHPTTGKDIFVAGFGETFNQIIESLKLLP